MNNLLLLLFVLGICASGYFYLCTIFNNKYVLYGLCFPTGAILHITFQLIPLFAFKPWVPLLLSILLSLLLSFFYRNNSKINNIYMTFYKKDYLLLAVNAIIWVIKLRTFSGYDEINHFFFASQIRQGIIPPVGFAFCNWPVKYHYGWDILLADVGSIGGCSWVDAEDILSILFIISNSIVLLFILKYIYQSTLWSFVGFICFMYGSGILGFIKPGNYLQLFSMYHQHAWAFTTSVLLFCLVILLDKKIHDNILLCLLVCGLALAAPVYSAHSILLWGLFLAFCGFYTLSQAQWNYHTLHKNFFIYATSGFILLLCWKFFNMGILVSGEIYDFPQYQISLQLLGIKNFLRYMGAYILMVPTAFIIIVFCIIFLIRSKYKINHLSPALLYASICVFLLCPMPFILMISNSAYWDNFCKFNYIGILCSWIVLPFFLLSIKCENKQKRNLIVILIVGISLLYPLMSIIKDSKALFVTKYSDSISSEKRELKNTLMSFPVKSILLINPELKEHYNVNKKTNKAEINLYQYINNFFGEYIFLSTELGYPVLNFYDYNFMYDRDMEYSLIDNLDSLYKGNVDSLSEINVSYVISNYHYPEYLEQGIQKGIIMLFKQNENENWSLFIKEK